MALRLDRPVSLLDDVVVAKELGFKLPASVSSIAFSSENILTKASDFEWNKTTGMLSVWILGQFIPSEKKMIIIPYKPSNKALITDGYFGKMDADRLKITDSHLFFFKAMVINVVK